MLPDGTIATYRYLPTVASEGLWASPYIASYAELASYIDGTTIDRRPTHLRFRTTHPSMVCDKIEIDFMTWE